MARAAPDRQPDGRPEAARRLRLLLGPLSAAGFVLAATGVRLWLGGLIEGLSVFSLYYPAILAAALVGGEVAAALGLALGFAISWQLLHPLLGTPFPSKALVVDLLLFIFTGAFVGAVGAGLRQLLRRRTADLARLADREARYRALFEGVSEGVALIEGVHGPDGRLVDMRIIEINPAMLKLSNAEGGVVGRLQSEIASRTTPDYLQACERAFRGERVRFEAVGPRSGRWLEIRLNRAGENRLSQIVVDITDQKATENRRTEMFDELNHRVKNNLAAVSAMLVMQAKASDDPRVREQLQKAVDRIQAIGDMHESLYRVSSLDQVNLGDYLRRLCERLSATLLDAERVRLEVDAAPVMAPPEEAVALGLIVNELVTNAAKHAFPPPARGVIVVSLKEAADGLELRVRDDGAGLPKVADGQGIGMRLVRSLAQQCRGELEAGGAPGASFTIRMPRQGASRAGEAKSGPL